MSVISALRVVHLLDDGARIFVIDVDHDGFIRLLAATALDVAEQHARAADAELEALAAHRLDQHAELEFTAARRLQSCRLSAASVTLIATFDSASRNSRSRIIRARHFGALAPRHRRIIDREAHRQRRRIDRLRMQRLADRLVSAMVLATR